MKLHFHGGAQSVTGANYLLEANGARIIIDCGLFQGNRFSESLNYEAFPYDPKSIDAVFITHSHADHTGRLPKIYKDGFRGKVFLTEPTKAVAHIALYDTYEKIKQEAEEEERESLYSPADIEGVIGLAQGFNYKIPIDVAPGVVATLHESSHILGATMIEFVVKENNHEERIVFTGDLGNPPSLLLNPIDYVGEADYLVIESAYGNRLHEDRSQRRELLLGAIRETVDSGGTLMIPSFAIERTQELLLELDTLFETNKLPRVPIFLDSPLASKITEAYGKFSNYFNSEAVEILKNNAGLFRFPWLKSTHSVEESKSINNVPAPKVIIAGSGMSQGGRILHHESRYLSDPNSSILFIGYQVKGSLGRRIQDGDKEVRIFGQTIPVKCRIRSIGAYSAHADQAGLVKCVSMAAVGGRLKNVFIVQGEDDSAQALAQKIREDLGIAVLVPRPHTIVQLTRNGVLNSGQNVL